MKIKNRKHVILNSDILAQNDPVDVTFNINSVTFQPDEVIIKSAFLNESLTNNSYRVHSSLIQNAPYALFIMQDSANALKMYNISYPVNSFIRGPYRFYLIDADNNIKNVQAINGLYFLIHLEFIEYDK